MKKVIRKIPATMASQHPDHASKPYWSKEAFISCQEESQECFLCFSELGIHEYKWDWEGKLVDESVMERMLQDYFHYFSKYPLGQKKFLTFRLPNPRVETEFRLGRALMGILSASALSQQIGMSHPPLFEVILPMTESADEMLAIQEAFSELSHLKHPLYRLKDETLKEIEIIPLFEQVETIIHSDEILKRYLRKYKSRFKKNLLYMRPYIARSDPALNSGLIATVLAIKIALSKYRQLEEKNNISLFPIIGSASLPFRGGLTPYSVDCFIKEYKGIRTALLQSAFRYDFPKQDVIQAVKKLEQKLPRQQAILLTKKQEKLLEEWIHIFETEYKKTVEGIAPLVNTIAKQLPKRRERVQHVGLFGYSRGVGKVKLPRAIGFTAALYSIGIPPEIIGTGRGIHMLKEKGEEKLLVKYYVHIKEDLLRAGRFINKKNIELLAKKEHVWKKILEDVVYLEEYLQVQLVPLTAEQKEHEVLSTEILRKIIHNAPITAYIEQAALLRKSLG